MDTPTPRTDAVMLAPSHRNYALQYVPADFARTLERELTASEERAESAEALVAQLTKERDALRDDVKILREALSIYRVPPV